MIAPPLSPYRAIAVLYVVCLGATCFGQGSSDPGMRVATYNTSLYRDEPGQLIRELEGGQNTKAKQIAEVIQRVRPDVILLNEFDYDAEGRAAELFCTQYLNVGQNGCEPIFLHYRFAAPVNTGRPSGRDLSKDGRLNQPNDAIGFGRHEGQYGMLLLSQYPIDEKAIRTFQNFLWRDMPEARLPVDPATGNPYYDEEDLEILRLSSKNFWDIPVLYRGFSAAKIHFLCSHPTPPVFDGPEDRNGLRNYDEIRLAADYIDSERSGYLVDDKGRQGGLAKDALFVIVGDLNADPVDGQSVPGAVGQLLGHPRVDSSFTPGSEGGRIASEKSPELNSSHRGDPAHDTANFGGEGVSNLRIDYVLPSHGLKVTDGGVFWPKPAEPGGEAVTASDHRLVWIDIKPATK